MQGVQKGAALKFQRGLRGTLLDGGQAATQKLRPDLVRVDLLDNRVEGVLQIAHFTTGTMLLALGYGNRLGYGCVFCQVVFLSSCLLSEELRVAGSTLARLRQISCVPTKGCVVPTVTLFCHKPCRWF